MAARAAVSGEPVERMTNKGLTELSYEQAAADKVASESLYSFFPKRLRDWYRSTDLTLSSGKGALESMGPTGQFLATRTLRFLGAGERRAGRAKVFMRRAIRDLLPDERDNLIDVLDSGIRPVNGRVADAAEAIRAIDREIAQDATRYLKVRKGGQVIPWVGRKYHFPHIMDADAVETALRNPAALRGTLIEEFSRKYSMRLDDVAKYVDDTKAADEFISMIRGKDKQKIFKDSLNKLRQEIHTPGR